MTFLFFSFDGLRGYWLLKPSPKIEKNIAAWKNKIAFVFLEFPAHGSLMTGSPEGQG